MPKLSRQYRIDLLLEVGAIQYDYSTDETIKSEIQQALNDALLKVKAVLYFSKVS